MQPLFKTIVVVAVSFFFAEKNTAQNLQNLTVENAVALARDNKPALRSYAVEEKINAARLAETRLRRGLKLSGTADAQVNPFLPASVIPVGQFNLQNPTDDTRAIRFGTWWQAGVGLTASISLLDASINAQLREQNFQSRLTANNLEEAGTNIAAEVIRAYYALLLAEEEIRFLESDLKRANTFLTDAEQRQSGGAALLADVNTARLQVNDAQLRLGQAQENRRLARENLTYRMGLPVERAAELTLGETLTGVLNKIEASASDQFDLAAAEQNRPDLRRLTLDNQLLELKIETEKARLKPTLNASAFLGMNNLSDGVPLFAKDSWFSNGNVALRLTVPISEHWEINKRTLPLALKQQQNAAQLDDQRQQLRYTFGAAYSGFTLAKQQMPVRQNDIVLATSNLELARAGFAGGNGLASAITDAEATLKQKQFAWLQTAYNLLLAELDMRLARGAVK
jgi:outer membrane protein